MQKGRLSGHDCSEAAATSRRGISGPGYPSRERPGKPRDAASSFGESPPPAVAWPDIDEG